MQTLYGVDKYALDLKHSSRSVGNRVSNVKLTIIDKVYTVTAQVQSDDGKHVFLEINLDKYETNQNLAIIYMDYIYMVSLNAEFVTSCSA